MWWLRVNENKITFKNAFNHDYLGNASSRPWHDVQAVSALKPKKKLDQEKAGLGRPEKPVL